jgi:hypothetical protein
MNEINNAALFSKIYKEFVGAFKEAALWASTDDAGTPLDDEKYANYTWHKDSEKRIEEDCTKFFNMAFPLFLGRNDAESAGHDFFLTRNGHGAGFWDGHWKFPFHGADLIVDDCGEFLTAAAKKYGELYVYPYYRKFRIF